MWGQELGLYICMTIQFDEITGNVPKDMPETVAMELGHCLEFTPLENVLDSEPMIVWTLGSKHDIR